MLLFLDINGSTALSRAARRADDARFRPQISVRPVAAHRRPWRRHLSLQGRRPDRDLELGGCVQQRCHLAGRRCDVRRRCRRARSLRALFGVAPAFRVGIHGGDVIVSEQGDAKRSIGIYGDAINIAARMEEAARAHNVRCVISESVADALADRAASVASARSRSKASRRRSRSANIAGLVLLWFRNSPTSVRRYHRNLGIGAPRAANLKFRSVDLRSRQRNSGGMVVHEVVHNFMKTCNPLILPKLRRAAMPPRREFLPKAESDFSVPKEA